MLSYPQECCHTLLCVVVPSSVWSYRLPECCHIIQRVFISSRVLSYHPAGLYILQSVVISSRVLSYPPACCHILQRVFILYNVFSYPLVCCHMWTIGYRLIDFTVTKLILSDFLKLFITKPSRSKNPSSPSPHLPLPTLTSLEQMCTN